MSELPPDLSRLRTLETWLVLSLDRVRRKIAEAERQEAEKQRGERDRPPAPDWLIEMGLGGRAPVYVHVGGCHMAGRRSRGVTDDQARRALWEQVPACPHCNPDGVLGVLD